MQYYFRPAVTWSTISSARRPSGTARRASSSTTKGPACFARADDHFAVIAYANSSTATLLEIVRRRWTSRWHIATCRSDSATNVVHCESLVEISSRLGLVETSWDFSAVAPLVRHERRRRSKPRRGRDCGSRGAPGSTVDERSVRAGARRTTGSVARAYGVDGTSAICSRTRARSLCFDESRLRDAAATAEGLTCVSDRAAAMRRRPRLVRRRLHVRALQPRRAGADPRGPGRDVAGLPREGPVPSSRRTRTTSSRSWTVTGSRTTSSSGSASSSAPRSASSTSRRTCGSSPSRSV